MALQIEKELDEAEPQLIGSILCKMGYMSEEQIKEVIKDIPEPVLFGCPNCGILIKTCPNCMIDLR